MASTSAPPSQEFVVRVPKDVKKVYGIMKFNPNNKVDFTKCDGAKVERENNLRDYKVAHNLDTMPKFGAGSEFGRDLKEEARRKKYGIYMKAYNVEDQPWLLKLGSGKTARNFKGTKEGGILDNASYYIFTQCADGAFEAFPVDEWHNFNPQIKYKHLSAEEAEEQYSKREQIMNYHTIMVQKRIRDDKDIKGPEDDEEKKSKKKKSKDFMLTEMDEWAILSDASDEGSDEDAILPKKQKKNKLSKKSGAKTNSDDEAVEESDEADEGREVDYMTDTDSEDEEMFGDKERASKDKYQEKGVEDEEALQKLIESDEEEEKPPEQNEEENENEKGEEKEKKESGSDTSSSSDSESDPDKESTFASALFMPVRKSTIEQKKEANEKKDKKKDKSKKKKKDLKRKGSFSSEGSSATNSRSATPTVATSSDTAKKDSTVESPAAKRPRVDTPIAGTEGLTEDTVRRYLMRKPMTTKGLLQKFKNLGLPNEKLVNILAEILKKLNPEKTKIKDKLYWFIKQ